jgi:hypothetical protein
LYFDNSCDERAVGDKLSLQSDDESPAILPPVNTVTDAAVDSTSILHSLVAHSESLSDGLFLSLFPVEKKVQVDLLQTLKRLRAPMIAYDEIIKWASRSCLQGHAFCDVPISSQKTVLDKLKGCMNLDSFHPHVKVLYLPYSKCFVIPSVLSTLYTSVHIPYYVPFFPVQISSKIRIFFSIMVMIPIATPLQRPILQ